MRIGEVIGTVTLSQAHPSLKGATWRIVVPLGRAALEGEAGGRGESLVLYDERGTGDGDRVAISEGAEAAAPFLPEQKPVDAYAAAILDEVTVEGRGTRV